MENTEGNIKYRVRRREVREKTPPDFDKRYVIIGEYRQGDGKRAVLPLILELERRKHIGLFLSLLTLHLLLLFIVTLNIIAIGQLTSAQTRVHAILANESKLDWIVAREVGRFSDGTRLIEISISFRMPALDSLLLVRRAYVIVKGE